MPLPAGVEMVTVSSGQPLALLDGTWIQGKLTFTGPDLVTIGAQDVTLGGEVTVDLVDGAFSKALVATDATGMSPTGWTYKVTANLSNAPDWIRYITLPKAAASVVLADVIVPDPVAGTYSVLVDQAAITALLGLTGAAIGTDVLAAQVTGDLYKRLILNAGGGLDLGPGTGPVDTNLYRGDVGLLQTDGSFAVGNALTVNGVVINGTPTTGQVLTANSPSAATWAAASGGGSSIRTASVRITDDNLGGLPSAASWAIVQTSAATKLQCSIAAAVGDRIVVVGRFMRSGSHFLDWTLLDSGGAIAIYAGTGTGSPLGEGDPALYPSLSFGYETGPPMFTVASGNISGGLATVALAHQGTGAGLVYAHTTYPFRMRLENIGPEPA